MIMFNYVALPATDFERAFRFYDALTGGRVRRNPDVPFPMAYFVDGDEQHCGHLFEAAGFQPSSHGALVYIRVDDVDVALAVIVDAGGTVTMPKAFLGPGKGSWARFLDPEGNQLALHAAS